MATRVVRTFVGGLDEEVLRGGIPAGHVVLVRGATGTMKSSLAYSILYRNALQRIPGLYVTFEQSAESLLEHMAHLGFRSDLVPGLLPILDLSTAREEILASADRGPTSSVDPGDFGEVFLSMLKERVDHFRHWTNFRLLAIDSLDAAEHIMQMERRRSRILAFFEWLRDLRVTSLLISEEPILLGSSTVPDEEVLADGILHLSMVPTTAADFQRRIQCVKMRSANHDSDFRTLLFEDGAFEVARAMA